MATPEIKTFTTILADLVAEGKARMTRITNWATGAVVHSILAVAAKGLEQLYIALARAIDLAFVDTATGIYLDLIGALIGVTRQAAVAAQGTVTLSRSTGASELVIAAGKIVGTEADANGVARRFKTDDVATMGVGVLSIEVAVTAEDDGVAWNVGSGTITRVYSTVPGVSVTNGEDWLTHEGDDEETDDDLRERIRVRWAAFSYGGTREAYESHAREVAGVDTVTVDALAPRGEGTVDVILTSTAPDGLPTSEVVDAVQLLVDERKPVDADVLVKAPTPVTVDIHVRLVQSIAGGDADTIEAAAEAAIEAMFLPNTGAYRFGVGQDVTHARIFATLIAIPYVDNVQVVEPATDTGIAPDELARLGTVTIEVV